ncbi:MAG TPA: diguanylate cyclase [Vicinamibacteria bacterium]|nr:diguanylate cyclase [Vicinamibacteria bacterium]
MGRPRVGIRYSAVALGLALAFAAACRPRPETRAAGGVADLSGWDFEARGPVRLAGEWVFRYRSLDGPAALPPGADPAPPYLAVPGSWNRRGLPGLGFATHAVRVRLPEPPPRQMALALGEAHAAERIYVNGRLVLQRGRVGEDASEERADPAPVLVQFPQESALLDIAVDVSNHFHYEGGLLHAPRLGLPGQLLADQDADTRIDHLILGCLGVLSLYYAILFVARPERSHLLFSLLTLIIVLRVAVLEWHLNALLPVGAAGQLRLDYFTLLAGPPVYYALLEELFPREFPRQVLRFALGFAGIGVAALALPTQMFTHLREPAIAAGLAVVTLAFAFVFRAAVRGREGAGLLAAACFVVAALALHDALARWRLIEESRELLPFGNAALIFSHAVVLGFRLSHALGSSEALTGRLQELNLDLEQRIRARTAELERLATTDPLTGLSNRRELQRLAEVERSRAHRYGHDLAVLVVDADHFKSINDTHGHAVGDLALQVLSSELLSLLRGHDLVGRWGGEEFVVALPHIDAARARLAAERVRQRLGEKAVPLPDGGTTRISVSIGGAVARPEESFEHALRRAETALYAAKAAGRNRVVIDES